jgi:hypothetical protein
MPGFQLCNQCNNRKCDLNRGKRPVNCAGEKHQPVKPFPFKLGEVAYYIKRIY